MIWLGTAMVLVGSGLASMAGLLWFGWALEYGPGRAWALWWGLGWSPWDFRRFGKLRIGMLLGLGSVLLAGMGT